MTDTTCGCCQGIEPITPSSTANRPGLSAIAYRVGTHATFLETMLARLSSNDFPQLRGRLKTRLKTDPAIAFLDAWATVADVLIFYQERIANEGYRRTATERRSILELGRLVGYKLRPGVAASVYLAFTIEKDQTIEIAPGNRAQSLPDAGEIPQSFETAEKLAARAVWNNLQPRLTRPQTVDVNSDTMTNLTKITIKDQIYLQGITTNLKPNDPLLFVEFVNNEVNAEKHPVLRRIERVELQSAENRTLVTLQAEQGVTEQKTLVEPKPDVPPSNGSSAPESPLKALDNLIAPLSKPPSVQPDNALRLSREVDTVFGPKSDIYPRLMTALRPDLSSVLYQAWQNITVDGPTKAEIRVYALRVRASVFGHNAPKRTVFSKDGWSEPVETEWTLNSSSEIAPEPFSVAVTLTPNSSEPAGSAVSLTIRTVIGLAAQQIANSRTLPAQGESFTLQQNSTDIAKVTVVELTETGNNLGAPLKLQFEFPNRNIALVLEIDANFHLHVTSAGSDPTQVEISSASSGSSPQNSPSFLGLFRSAASQGNDGLTMKVSGTIRPSGRTEEKNVIWLDATYGQIVPQSWVVIERPEAQVGGTLPISQQVISQTTAVSDRSRSDYGISIKSTRLELDQPWIDPDRDSFHMIRETAVFAQSEELKLAEEPILEAIGPVPASSGSLEPGKEIELSQLYDDLDTGRWIVVSGERADLPGGAGGVKASELVMLAGIKQRQDPKPHTVLQLAQSLAYTYKRDTATIYGNVVKATHGETRTQVLGSGNAAQELQSFPLQQFPVTYLSAPTAAGAVSTLNVRVNEILWHETDTLSTLKPGDRQFVTQTDDTGKTTVFFGNGRQGARPPSGIENIKAIYRTGLGLPGNVKAEQISLLATRPLGVKSIINPLPATGGADPESRDQARQNLPLALMALDRLVSVQDYTDFARTYAGIGKASAVRLSDGQRPLVHLTIAGANDSAIDENSDLFRNFRQALQHLGDPNQAVKIEQRELLLLVIVARAQILPDYLWEVVKSQITVALFATFSFDRRDLGQPVFLSEVIRTIQQVPGVAYVNVDTFGGIPEKKIDENTGKRRPLTPSEISAAVKDIKDCKPVPFLSVNLAGEENNAAQIAYLSPAVPDTFVLNQIY